VGEHGLREGGSDVRPRRARPARPASAGDAERPLPDAARGAGTRLGTSGEPLPPV
jgi:hypothetical protein